MTVRERLAENLRNILAQRHMTIDALADESGVRKGTIINWLYVRHSPTLEPLYDVANALDMTIDELVKEKK